MKDGQIIDEINAKGKRIIFRYPSRKDAKKFLDFINKAMNETQFLLIRNKIKLKEEKKWLSEMINDIKKKDGVHIVAEHNGKIIGGSGIFRDKGDAKYYIGTYGIAILQDYTGIGIGTKLTQIVIEKIKENTDLRIIQSGYFEGNICSERLQKKFGFKKYGVLPKAVYMDGKMKNEILLYRVL